MDKYKVIGLMSGTSLDGVDLAYCEISLENNKWSFTLLKSETIPYEKHWLEKLSDLENISALEYVKSDVKLGEYFGQLVAGFIQKNNLNPDFIASHGHTIFHQPEIRLTSQIANGAAIVSKCKLPVINNFRIADVAFGGQGAPLVPIGDQLFFPEYKYCLNLGGFANISQKSDPIIAYDICPCNIVLNYLSNKLDLPFDKNGAIGKEGAFNKNLFDQLNSLNFYSERPPKSLGKEWVVEHVFPILDKSKLPVNDLIHTFCEHIAFQINKSLGTEKENDKILITGGGAFNSFLISLVRKYSQLEVVIPGADIINYKEAIVFALLGALRWRQEPNCLSSVTGAEMDVVGGTVHWG